MSNSLASYALDGFDDHDRLFEDHLPLVKTIAHHVASRLPPGISVEDLIQVGMIGLLEAARVYDASLGASFKSYASIRVRGAIMDELRRQSWMPRSVQKKARQVSQAIQAVEKRLGRAATNREIAAEMNETLEQYGETLEVIAGGHVFSLDDEDNGLELEDAGLLPFQHLHDKAVKLKLVQVIAALPEKERLVISLYYDNELNLREIGEVLEVSESRVCQIHSQAISRIRSRMKDWLDND